MMENEPVTHNLPTGWASSETSVEAGKKPLIPSGTDEASPPADKPIDDIDARPGVGRNPVIRILEGGEPEIPRRFKFRWPYITADLPGIGGQIRATPEHFVVEEVPLYPALGEGQHLYVNITKEGMTTREVQQRLARLFDVAYSAVGFAGMKDKYARTTQTLSVQVGHVSPDFVVEAAQRIAQEIPVTVNWVRLHRNKLKKGHLLGNRFSIVITHLEIPAAEALTRAQAVVDRIRAQGLPNFYGPQRLGLDGDNVRRGLELLFGRRRVKDRWLRSLLLASVQSYLCNRYLAYRVEMGLFDRLLAGDIAKKYATGGLFEVWDVEAEQPRYQAKEISFTAPIYGPKMWEAKDEAGELERQVLAESGLSMELLAQAGLTGTRRLGRLLLQDLTVEPHPEGIQVHFFLPKGAFATTVLRELMKVDDKELASVAETVNE